MTAGRRLDLGLEVLDHQIVARGGWMAGNVDDLELTPSEDGTQLYVTAILAGPGVLWQRLGARRLGRWLQRAHREVDGGDPGRIPFNIVQHIGPQITVAADDDELGTSSGERWVREHVVGRIPGSRHEPPE